jgi:hypothetical protein
MVCADAMQTAIALNPVGTETTNATTEAVKRWHTNVALQTIIFCNL